MKIRLLKTIFIPITVMMLAGCGATSSYYMLSVPTIPTKTYAALHKSIGVEKVTLPSYFDKRLLAVAHSSSQIRFHSSAVWAEDMNTGLTNRLIGYLQKTFHQPQVYAYPWDTHTQPELKVRVQVTRFIAQGDRVYLDANWEIANLQNNTHQAKLFSTSVKTGNNAENIVQAMDSAFSQLETQLAQGMRHF